ncbi:MAG: DUF3800 domain-containing protein [Chloroflexota bacterium]
MTTVYNIYCDESCHLENDRHMAMVLGAVWCPLDRVREVSACLRDIKKRHSLSRRFEIKWSKVSPAKQAFYLEVVDYFFDNDDLHFRALIVPDKSTLRHKLYGQDHDTWYYKMFFDMLKVILSPQDRYRIYLDIKDTRSAAKVSKLHDVLSNNIYDFSREIVEHVQTVRSDEVEIIQLADLLVGAVSYVNRGLSTSTAKLDLVQQIRNRSGYELTRTTLLQERKVNILVWRASEEQG